MTKTERQFAQDLAIASIDQVILTRSMLYCCRSQSTAELHLRIEGVRAFVDSGKTKNSKYVYARGLAWTIGCFKKEKSLAAFMYATTDNRANDRACTFNVRIPHR